MIYFSPINIPGLGIWLDASDLGSITKDGSNLVSQWNDKSGNGNHATQATGANQPLYSSTSISGLPAILFDDTTGNTNRLTIPDAPSLKYTRCSWYIVCQRTRDLGTSQGIFVKYDSSGSPTREWQFLVNSTDGFNFNGSSTGSSTNINFSSSQTADLSAPFIVHADFNAVNVMMGVNNANYATAASTAIVNSTGVINIGGGKGTGSPFAGRISEMLFFNRCLTTTEHAEVLNYLSAKWLIKITEPFVHSVYLLSGQSNAVGEADLTDLPTTLNTTFNNFKIYNTSSTSFEAMIPGVNNLGAASEFGPECQFGYLFNAISSAIHPTYLIKITSIAKHLANDVLETSFYPITGRIWDGNATIPFATDPVATTSGSKTITLSTKDDHGLVASSSVVLSGLAAVAGIPTGELNTTFTVISAPSSNTFTVAVSTTSATASISGGGIFGTWQSNSKRLVQYLDDAMNKLRTSGVLGEIKAINWMQGEHDAKNLAWANTYGANLVYFSQQLRSHLYSYGYGSPDILFAYGKIWLTDTINFPYRDIVRNWQDEVQCQIPNAEIIETSSFINKSDGLHFNATSQLLLGQAFFNTSILADE